MRLSYHPEAEEELAEAVSFYASRDWELGSDLKHEIEAAINSILDNPEQCEIVEGDIRRRRVRRFPYDLCFQVDGDLVRILVVMHHSRDPDYWKHRQ